jgi:hypothetical protein
MTTVLRRNVDFVLLTADKIKYWHFLCRTDYNEEQKIAHCEQVKNKTTYPFFILLRCW